MGRHKEPDKLTKDSTAAIEAGMSYGKYMALKDHMSAPRIHWENYACDIELEPNAVCQHCGKPYRKTNNRQKYCTALCRYYANYNYVKKGNAHGESKDVGDE